MLAQKPTIKYRPARMFAALLALTISFSGNAAAQYWTPIDALIQRLVGKTLLSDTIKSKVSIASDGTLVAVDTKDQVWQWNYTDTKWELLPGALRQISVASKTEFWGVTAKGELLRYSPPTSWVKVSTPGSKSMRWISAASDGTIIGITVGSEIHRFDAKAESWTQLPGQLSEVAAGSASNIWGVNASQQVWHFDAAAKVWNLMPGTLTHISVGSDGEVWGTSGTPSDARLWRWSGQKWQQMLGKLQDVAVGSASYIAGVTNDEPLPVGGQPVPAGTPKNHHTVIGKTRPDFCWKNTVTRGVGTIPAGCSLDKQKRGLLCYPSCKTGFSPFVATCMQNCPAGFRDDGLLCAKPAAYGRGGGYPWQFGDALNNDGMLARCRAASGTGCEMNGAIAYPTCQAGFAAVGANICSPVCPAGMADGGVSCTKQTYTQSAATLRCAGGQVNDAGLCYPSCPGNTTGAGPVCWGVCKGDTPFECAAGCARDQTACAQHTSDIVISSMASVVSIVSMVVAPGAGDIINTAITKGLKELAIKILQYSIPKLTSMTIKESVLLASELSGVPISADASNNWATFLTTLQKAGAESNDVTTAYSVIESLPLDPLHLDITGVSKVAIALTNPVCDGPSGPLSWSMVANEVAGK